jgi:sugar phosphate isomerase/epimerase
MYTCLSPGAIGLKMALPDAIELAAATSFEGLDFCIGDAADLAGQRGDQYVKDLFAKANVRVGNWGCPVDFRRDEVTYQAGMSNLPRQAYLAQQLGATRCATGMLPFSDELRFMEHFELIAGRLRPVAQILADHGLRLGLEFVGPHTLRQAHKFGFISTLDGVLALCSAIGVGNVGLLLDSFHWYTSHGTASDLAGCGIKTSCSSISTMASWQGPDDR